MANWAIVIGIDQYWKPQACLRGAVRDALNIREWMVRVDGGAVPPRNLFLLLGRAAGSPQVPPGVQAMNATRADIVTAIEELLVRSRGEGERFFFYFSGHGISVRKDLYEENATVPSDFTDLLTDQALSLRSIQEIFKGTAFRQEFFIVDACRNLPWEEDYRISDYPRPRKPMRPVPPQWVMLATSPGTKAIEINEQGAFTEALLDGLKGDGPAKDWDDDAQEYVLRWDHIFTHVGQVIEQRALPAGEGQIQAPRKTGEHGDEDPELGRFAPEAFPDVTLDVFLEPETVASHAEVVVGHFGGDVQRKSQIDQLPVRFSLKPRPYGIRAIATEYRPERDYYRVDLYEPKQVLIRLVQGRAVMRGEEREAYLTKALGGPPTPGAIEVSTSDDLARLELLDSAGRVLVSEEGSLQRSNLAPGYYRARLVTPEGRQVEELIELLPGETERIHLGAPAAPDTRLFREVLAATGITVSDQNTIEPSEMVGAVATAQLSTLLALAGAMANEAKERPPERSWGEKLQRLHVSALRDFVGQPAVNGIQVLFGIEAEDPAEAAAYLAQAQLRCWKQSDPVPVLQIQPKPLRGPVGLAEYAWATDPGPHWLSIETPGQRSIAFAVTVLSNRAALIVFQRGVDGKMDIYQYLPALVPGEVDRVDPRAGGARFPVIQRSELVQRAYLAGRLEEPGESARMLLYAKCTEPIAGVLGGYIQLRVNPSSELLDVASNNMVRYFGELSDSHVLRAEYLDGQGRAAEAASVFRSALDRGLPVMQEGLAYLLHGVADHGIEHPQVERMRTLYEARVPGLLWTAVPVELLSSYMSVRPQPVTRPSPAVLP
jgi:hypothetical protein